MGGYTGGASAVTVPEGTCPARLPHGQRGRLMASGLWGDHQALSCSLAPLSKTGKKAWLSTWGHLPKCSPAVRACDFRAPPPGPGEGMGSGGAHSGSVTSGTRI